MYKPYNSKRAEEVYNLSNGWLSKVKLADSREERIRGFLESIEFSNANDILVEALENMDIKVEEAKAEKHKVRLSVKYPKLQLLSTRSTYEWNEYFDVMKNAFKDWKYSQEMRQRFGKDYGSLDIVRLYLYCVTH